MVPLRVVSSFECAAFSLLPPRRAGAAVELVSEGVEHCGQPDAFSVAYEHSVVPGLLQSEGYARTLIRSHQPSANEAEIDRRVELRLGRQAILKRPIDPPAVRVVLREAVIRTVVGGPAVMVDQLDHLAEVSEMPNVSLRIVPASSGYHPGIVTGAFTVLRFPLNGGGVESEPPTIYQEMYTAALYLDKPAEFERFDAAFEVIWNTALDERSSGSLIGRAAEDMRDG